CRQVVKLSLQTIAFRDLWAEARRASIASGLPAHGRMSGDFRLGAIRDSGPTDSKSALNKQPDRMYEKQCCPYALYENPSEIALKKVRKFGTFSRRFCLHEIN